jgi:hypothetical protein
VYRQLLADASSKKGPDDQTRDPESATCRHREPYISPVRAR